MILALRYSIRSQNLQGLYDLIDTRTNEFIGEPMTWDDGLFARALAAISIAMQMAQARQEA